MRKMLLVAAATLPLALGAAAAQAAVPNPALVHMVDWDHGGWDHHHGWHHHFWHHDGYGYAGGPRWHHWHHWHHGYGHHDWR